MSQWRRRTFGARCTRSEWRPFLSGSRLFPFARLGRLLGDVAHFGVHAHIVAPALFKELAGFEVIALGGALGRLIHFIGPFSERMAEPWGFRFEFQQSQLLPNDLGALHEFALGKRNGWEIFLEGSIDQDGRVLATVTLAARAMSLITVRQDVKVKTGIGTI